MKHNYFLLLFLFLSGIVSAQEIEISGGNAHTVLLTQDGKVYTYGANNNYQLGRTLQPGEDKTSIPGEVTLPQPIQAVDAGFGFHTLALGCNGQVWAWGLNTEGQLGNGINSETIAPSPAGGPFPVDQHTPVQVCAGATNPTAPMEPLENIIAIAGGLTASYAITSSNELLAWGSDGNGYGSTLGSNNKGWSFSSDYSPDLNGGTSQITESSLPVYVLNGETKLPLENVIAVSAGYSHAYALVDNDNDGDPTTGHVYAIGGSAYGTPLIAGLDSSTYCHMAIKVIGKNGDPISGISHISAYETGGYFIRKSDGRVYSVGSDDGGARGIASSFDDLEYAEFIAAGDQENYTAKNYLYNITSIAGGQIFGLAVSKINSTGHLLSWGKLEPYFINSSSNTDGGYLGLGNPPTGEIQGGIQTPRIVTFENGDTIKNVTSVKAGSGTSYITTLDPLTKETKIFVCGNNIFGQLGLGNKTGSIEDYENRYYPVEFTLENETLAEVCPEIDFKTDKLHVCVNGGLEQELYTGSQSSFGAYKWEHTATNGTITDLSTETSSTKGDAYLTATELGLYTVTISDNRTPSTLICEQACPTVSASIELIEEPAPFTDLKSEFCAGDLAEFDVELAPEVTTYEFFDAPFEGNSLGTGTQSGSNVNIFVNENDAVNEGPIENDPYYSEAFAIWIEDKTLTNGSILSTSTTGGQENDFIYQQQLLVPFNDIHINSVLVNLKSYSGTTTATLRPYIYKSSLDLNGNPVPMANENYVAGREVLWEGDDIEVQIMSSSFQSYTIAIQKTIGGAIENLLLEGNVYGENLYWFGLENVGSTSNFVIERLEKASGTDWPYVDDITGDLLHISGSSNFGNFNDMDDRIGLAHSYSISKPSDYKCKRKKITSIRRNCPPVTYLSTFQSDTTINCQGDTEKLNFSYQLRNQSDAPDINYAWYHKETHESKDSTLVASGTLAYKEPEEITKPGIYSITLSSDTHFQFAISDSTEVFFNAKPEYDFSEGITACEGEELEDITLTLTGIGPWTIEYFSGITETVGTKDQTTAEITITPAGQAVYGLTSIEDRYCVGEEEPNDTAMVVINTLPTVSVQDLEICAGEENYDITTGQNLNPVFSDDNSYVTSEGLFTAPMITVEEVFEVHVTETNEYNCKNSDVSNITVHPLPVVEFTLDPVYCSESIIDLGAASMVNGMVVSDIVFESTPALVISAEKTVMATDLLHDTEYTFTAIYTDPIGCTSESSTTTKVIHIPAITETINFTTYMPLEPTITGEIGVVKSSPEVVVHWLDSDGNPMIEKTETITVTHPVGEQHTYQAYQTLNGCIGDTVDVYFGTERCKAEIPTISDEYFCSNDAYKTISAQVLNNDYQIGWLPEHLAQNSFFDVDPTSDEVIMSDSYTITETAEGEYIYYVASYDPIIGCWSTSSRVSFYLVDEPVASISIPEEDKIVCATDNNPIEIPVSPAFDANGITPTFTINGMLVSKPEIIPSEYTYGTTLDISYSVEKVITPTGWNYPKSCESLVWAQETVKVESIEAPTVSDKEIFANEFPYAPISITDPIAYSYKWEDINGVTVSIENSYSYDTQIVKDTIISLSITAVTEAGCESHPTIATYSIIGQPCPDLALEVSQGFSECQATLASYTPEFHVFSTIPADAYIEWTDEEGNIIGQDETYTPTDLSVGTHIVRATAIFFEGCTSGTSDITYEVLPAGEPSIFLDIPASDMCVYENAQTIQATLNGEAIEGTFFIDGKEVAETGSSLFFIPSENQPGDHTISFIANDNSLGCNATSSEYTVTIHEVDRPVLSDFTVKAENLVTIDGKETYTFEIQPIDDLNTYWFTENTSIRSTPDATGSNFQYELNPQLSESSDSTYTVYVAHENHIGCLSDNVSLTIRLTEDVLEECTETQEVSIEGLVGKLSISDNSIMLYGIVNGNEATGEWLLNATTINASFLDIDPSALGVGEHTVSYSYTDGNNCTETTPVHTIVITEENPTQLTTDQLSMAELLQSGKKWQIWAENIPTGATVQWFSEEVDPTASVPVGTDPTLEVELTSLPDELPNEFTRITETYYYNFKLEDGTQTELQEYVIEIMTCPVPAPLVSNEVMCFGGEIPALTATRSDMWPDGVDADNTTSLEIRLPDNTMMISLGSYAFEEVSEGVNSVYFRAVSDGYNCASPWIEATLVVEEVVAPTKIHTSSTSCYNSGEEFIFSVAPSIGSITQWYTSTTETLPVATGNTFTVSTKDGSQEYYASHKTINIPGCESEKVGPFTLTVLDQIPSPITNDNIETCLSDRSAIDPETGASIFPDTSKVYELSAVKADPKQSISWYSDSDLTNKVGDSDLLLIKESDLDLSDLTNLKNTFYAVATDGNCASEAVEASITPLLSPLKPTVAHEPQPIDANPEFGAEAEEGTTINWYDEYEWQLYNTGEETLHPSALQSGERLTIMDHYSGTGYFGVVAIASFDNGCMSAPTQFVLETVSVESNENSITVYPNPTNGLVIIENSNNENLTIEITDNAGRIIISTGINTNKNNQVDLSYFPVGLYIMKVVSNSTVKTVIIEKL